MTASYLIERARSLSDLVNSKFISYEDEVSSLNESYRDIYSWLCNNDDDYYVKEYFTTVVPNVANDPTVSLITLPEDFYKLRFIDYQFQGNWTRVRKYSTEERDNNPSGPKYRFYGKELRIIGVNPNGANGNLRIVYYPPAEVITLPNYAYNFATSYFAHQKVLVRSPIYVPEGNTFIYTYANAAIRSESIDDNTVATPFDVYTPGGTLTSLGYYKGYLLYISAGNIYRCPYTPGFPTTTTTALTTSSNVTSLRVVNNLIYYATSTPEIRSITYQGSSDTLVQATAGSNFCWYNGALAYLDASGYIVMNGATSTIQATYLTGDGVYLYYLDSSYQLHRYSALEDLVIREGVALIGPYSGNYLPIEDVDDNFMAISTTPDWDFTYPLNEVNEIMAYQCAIDFKRKQNADFSQLSMRMAELQRRMLDVIKRDEGLPQKIGNAYSQYDSTWR